MVDNIVVSRFKNNEAMHVARISNELLQPILEPFNKMGSSSNTEFLIDVDFLPDESSAGFFTIKVNDNIAGVMMISTKDQKRVHTSKLSFFKLIRKYGFFKTLGSIAVIDSFSKKLKEDEMYVDYIVVSKEYRGLGLGTKLLNYGEEIAKNLKKRTYSLDVMGNNLKAKKLNEKLGFDTVKTTKFSRYIRKKLGTDKSYLMVKKLKAE